jgi:radical SAM protein with 4Fe4S-binding SPASM domain
MLSNVATVSDELSYGMDNSLIPEKLREFVSKQVPIVVWNITNRCNLNCLHCYAKANTRVVELSSEECKKIVNELAEFGVPMILFSGGEPLLRQDIFEIADYAKKRNIRVILSTNGTLIDESNVDEIKVFDYVGISLDGIKIHDKFRGLEGAFKKAIKALEVASDVTMTGIRFTLTKYNFLELPDLVKLAKDLAVPRFCVYHLVPSGKASFEDDIDNATRRRMINFLMKVARREEEMEILTVDNPADGVYVYLETQKKELLEFLKFRGGDSSGVRLACIDEAGNLHPNQFWLDYNAGNVLLHGFRNLWLNDPLFKKLREKEKYLQGKCGVCRFKSVCGGFRVRALRFGNLWGWDPSCYIFKS